MRKLQFFLLHIELCMRKESIIAAMVKMKMRDNYALDILQSGTNFRKRRFYRLRLCPPERIMILCAAFLGSRACIH